MTSERQKLIDKIFTHALELSADERSSYLEQTKAEDGIRRAVDELLAAADSDRIDEKYGAVFERVWSDIVERDESRQEDLEGQRFDHWQLDRRIARGGLATVYLAHRDDGEFDQRVAFKVLRRGLDTDDVIARFRAERQILSTLDHPAIAQIHDGGALPDGRPYLVLEYVDGEHITTHCDRLDIDVRGRITMMIDVLRGLHHAHRHTVVHRDIKPSNILVSEDGNVALLDFGIAKLLDPDALPGTSTLTRTGVSLLTPGYGSPEQHAGEPVTTASDIYQAGAVLYELLAGRRPRLAAADKQVANSEPPSSHVRGTPFYRQVHGDLDAIVRMAMQPDPTRRYGSANEMVADLERFLDGRPVVARPDTLGYRLRMLARRRPWLLPVLGIAIVGIAAYVVTLTLYSQQLLLQERRAEAAQAFMVDLISSPDPFAPADPERGRNITVVEALEIGRRRVERDLSEQPELNATLLGSLASMYQSLDQNDAAIELAEKALALNIKIYGEQSEPALESLGQLADGYGALGDFAQARQFHDRRLTAARAMFSPDDPRVGAAEVGYGIFENSQGNPDAALILLNSGIDKLRAAPIENAQAFIQAVVASRDEQGLYEANDYLDLLDEALEVAEAAYGEDSLYVANVLLAIARNYSSLGEIEQAKSNYAIGLEMFAAQLGPLHSDTIAQLNNYGYFLIAMGDDAAAETVHRELIERLIESRGESHRLVADNYQNLASAIHRQGRFDEALPLHRKARDIYVEVLDRDNYIAAFPLLSIAYVEMQRGNGTAAESAAVTALETFRAEVPDSFMEGVAMCLVGLAKERSGDVDVGAAMVEASHKLMQPKFRLLAKSPYPELCRMP